MNVRINQKLDNFNKALTQLKSALDEPIDKKKIIIDGTIQRFEFCYELCWKLVKTCLEQEGIEATTPRQALQEAYKAKWISEESTWLFMMKDRNTTSHVYDEKIALDIYQRIKQYYVSMEALNEFLLTRYTKIL